MGDVFTTVEAVHQTGATYRQLDYWCRMGWIPGMPRKIGSGYERQWTPAQIEEARWLALASDSFYRGGRGRQIVDIPALANFMKRAAEAGVKP
jgi:hypothetical protein